MSHHIVEFDQACKSCKATGLYVGIGERDGSAVVCHTCKGTGKHHVKIEYDDFEGRPIRKDVQQVVEVNPGICIGKGEHGQYRLSDFGGMPYSDWLCGKPFPTKSESRRFTCPAWWYQSADYEKKPKWDECRSCGSFSDCRFFPTKDQCWARFDKENSR